MNKFDRKVIIALAPAARSAAEKSERGGQEQVISVMTPEEIANDVIESVKNGASVIHMHVRDKEGKLTEDLTEFRRTVGIIKNHCDPIIEGSTGGVSELEAGQRGGVLNVEELELAALTVGSVNIGGAAFVNRPEDIDYWAKLIEEKGKLPVLECFEPGMINMVDIMLEEGSFKDGLIYGIPMGFEGSQPASTPYMQRMIDLLPKGAAWYYQQHGMRDLSMLAAAVAAGAKIIRVGFEDSFYYAPGCMADSNAMLVKKAAEMISSIGYQVATPEEAREMLGLKKHSENAGA